MVDSKRTPHSRPMNLLSPMVLGKYQLLQRLGCGGMAEVWRAKMVGPAGFQRTLVVKRILPHLVLDPHFVRMFVAEARLSARLSHPNIVQVFELVHADEEYFIAMEYVRGHDLVSIMRSYLEVNSVPPVGLSTLAIRDVCRALSYAHDLADEHGIPLGIIHRDVTPSNIMCSFDGVVKLLDFGIAKALNQVGDAKTKTGSLKGKFGYMAPEQLGGDEFDHRVDLFSVGVVLHEMLTGRRLFQAANEFAIIDKVREAKVPRPSIINPAVPPELERICLKALARLPGDRYRSCEDMARDLDRVTQELKWGQERLAETLRELFPDEAPITSIASSMTMDEGTTLPGSGTAPVRKVWAATRVRRQVFGLLASVAFSVSIIAAAHSWSVKHARSRAQGPASVAVVVTPTVAKAPPMVKPSPPSPRERSIASAPPPVAPAAPALPEIARVLVDSTPRGAEVFVDGDRSSAARGRTPISIDLPRGERPVHLMVLANGYQRNRIEVTPRGDSQVKLILIKIARPVAGKRERAALVKPAARQPVGTSAKVRGGGVVDPFDRP